MVAILMMYLQIQSQEILVLKKLLDNLVCHG